MDPASAPTPDAKNCPLCGSTSFSTLGYKSNQTWRRCRGCRAVVGSSFWRVDDDAASMYDEDYLAKSRNFHPRTAARHEEILAFTERKTSGRSMIEVGFGNGQFLSTARERGWSVVGVEVSKAACDWAKDELGLNVFCGAFEDMPVDEASVDLVASMETIEHLHDPVGFIAWCHEVLRADGILFLTTPNGACLTGKLIGLDWRGFSSGHTILFSASRLARLLRDTGFQTIRVETRTIIPQSIVSSWKRRLSGKASRDSAPPSSQLDLYEIRERVEGNRLLRSAKRTINGVLNATKTGDKTLIWARKDE